MHDISIPFTLPKKRKKQPNKISIELVKDIPDPLRKSDTSKAFAAFEKDCTD